MHDLEAGQELEVRLPIEFEGRAIPMGARARHAAA